ncbi:uncharacterized protein STEHIDRAFT_123286 [Stereum hirsutum FP-91666 SS1]|uniref:uncharacterized protein n=1 Tax=Stereum hirsutum (strain FP-91666) TaxID=721885 RepID=UPI00044499B3|nr:uncharacterized protein STEHIDRAFT_123286 [Stereum hirsutum FP-91666 SS1]EIM84509.1 hypothetical protein STEHIDRAFT_123286 [Stereum hirsutum FP-91666 SS1]
MFVADLGGRRKIIWSASHGTCREQRNVERVSGGRNGAGKWNDMDSRRTAPTLYTRPDLCLSLEASATRRNEVKARFVAERIQDDPVA